MRKFLLTGEQEIIKSYELTRNTDHLKQLPDYGVVQHITFKGSF